MIIMMMVMILVLVNHSELTSKQASMRIVGRFIAAFTKLGQIDNGCFLNDTVLLFVASALGHIYLAKIIFLFKSTHSILQSFPLNVQSQHS